MLRNANLKSVVRTASNVVDAAAKAATLPFFAVSKAAAAVADLC